MAAGPGSDRENGTPRQVLLVDDHPLYRMALASTLKLCGTAVRVHEAASVAAALACIAATVRLDLIVYDWHLPQLGGLAGLSDIGQQAPGVPILVMSADEEPALRIAARSVGAEFLSKTAGPDDIRRVLDQLLAQVRRPSSGGTEACPIRLTQRQNAVLQEMARGLSNKRIGMQLGIRDSTVNAHVTDILRALAVNNRTEAVLAAGRLGLIELPHGGAAAR